MKMVDERISATRPSRTWKPSRRTFVTSASALALSLSGFVSPASFLARAATASEFRWGLPEEPDSLDAQATPRAISVPVLNYLGDSLLYRDPNGNRVPGLAKSWRVSPDGATVEF